MGQRRWGVSEEKGSLANSSLRSPEEGTEEKLAEAVSYCMGNSKNRSVELDSSGAGDAGEGELTFRV